MRGAALCDEEFVDVSRLFQFAADQVPLLAGDIGGIQRPQIAVPKGASFDVGQLKAEDEAAVPLTTPRPLILRPTLLNADEGFDSLNLSSALRGGVDAASYASVRGGGEHGAAIFVDADEMSGGGIQPGSTR